VRKDSRLTRSSCCALTLRRWWARPRIARGGRRRLFGDLPARRSEVNVWAGGQQTLECSCHYSHYNPREGASVIDGPAPRALAALPLKIVDGKLAVAKPSPARVGIVPN